MWEWFELANMNDLAQSELPAFSSGLSIDRIEVMFYIINTVNIDGGAIDPMGIVEWNNQKLEIPFDDWRKVNVHRSKYWALRVYNDVLILGVNRDQT